MTVLKYKPNLKKRTLATLLDYTLYGVAALVYMMFFGEETVKGGWHVSGLAALPLFIAWVVYFVVIEAQYRATLAHQGFNLKVLTIDRKPIGLRQSLKRHLLDPLDFFYGIPAFIAIKNSEKHQRLGDMWAKTIVVDLSDEEQYIQRKVLSRQVPD